MLDNAVSLGEHDGFEVFVDKIGTFYSQYDGKVQQAETLKAVLTKVRAERTARRKVGTKVPISDSKGNPGVVYGIHASTQNLLLEWTKGGKEQSSNYSPPFRRFSDEDASRMLNLIVELKAVTSRIQAEQDEIRSKYKVSMKELRAEVEASFETAKA